MSGALIILGGIAFIGLSLFFKFTPRLRVVIGLLVGGTTAGLITKTITHWLATCCSAIAGPVGHGIGRPPHSVEVALPTVIALVLATIVVVFLRRKGGHGGGAAGAGGRGRHGGGGGGGRAGGLATAALVCALLLPIVAGQLGEAIRSVA